jgi:hypothetical protein
VQAKTSIPGLGKPITAVDVTFDGRWILATTDDYLMVVKASFNDDGGCLDWEWWGVQLVGGAVGKHGWLS